MQIDRKNGKVYIFYSDCLDLYIYRNEKIVASKSYDGDISMRWDCYCLFDVENSDWTFVDYLPEPYRNWLTVEEVLNSYGGETLLFEDHWDIVTDDRQYICVSRDKDGSWNVPGKTIKDHNIRFITLTESNHV